MRILYVVDTHIHADHLSAGRALAEAAGAEYVLFAEADAASPFPGFETATCSSSAMSRSRCSTRPGTRPSIFGCWSPIGRAPEPWFAFTGHTLMVGDVGRTELATVEEGARILFRQLSAVKALPDHIGVLPGAFAGSVCGRRLSGKPMSTIGFERRHNVAFRIEDEEAFVRAMLTEIPPPPPRAAELRAANAGLALA